MYLKERDLLITDVWKIIRELKSCSTTIPCAHQHSANSFLVQYEVRVCSFPWYTLCAASVPHSFVCVTERNI